MFILGHMGIGSKLVSPWAQGLPRKWLLFGTILPDLIDKPLYYGLVWATGRHGVDLGLISGTRTFGHSAVFLLALTGFAVARRSRILAAICLGVATHLILDSLGQSFMGTDPSNGILLAIAFPLLGLRFPVLPYTSLHEHLHSFFNPYVWGGEIVGALLLGWEFWKSSHRSEILAYLSLRRQDRKLAKRRPRS